MQFRREMLQGAAKVKHYVGGLDLVTGIWAPCRGRPSRGGDAQLQGEPKPTYNLQDPKYYGDDGVFSLDLWLEHERPEKYEKVDFDGEDGALQCLGPPSVYFYSLCVVLVMAPL